MKRVHVHVGTRDLEGSRRFYSALLGAEPAIERDDYLKWSLDDPPLNLAVSTFAAGGGVDHLGIEVDDDALVPEVDRRLQAASQVTDPEPAVECCYHRSTKVWATDPQGVAWECFRSHGLAPRAENIPTAKVAACCAPAETIGGACCS